MNAPNLDPVARELWARLHYEPSDVETMPAAAIRSLLAWKLERDPHEFAHYNDRDARQVLISWLIDNDLLAALTRVNIECRTLGLEPLTVGQLCALADVRRAEEAREMIDDWQARVGISAELCNELAELVTAAEADDHYIRTRG